MNLEEYKKKIDICSVCAACFARGPIVPHNWKELPPPEWQSPDRKCPSYEYYNFRSHTGMGRLILATSVFRENFPVDEDLVEVINTCTNCGICNEICPTFRPLDAINALREEIVRRGLQPNASAKMDANVAECHHLFRGKTKAKALENLPAEGEDVYFSGCDAAYRQPEVANATVGVLKAGGVQVANLGNEEWCCGWPARWGGNIALSEELAHHNVDAVKRTGAKRLIVSCAHCYQSWKSDYPKFMGDLPFEVVHVAQVFSRLIGEGRIRFNKEINKKFTYHDPCFLGRHGRVFDEPRKVLRSLPGVQFNEMERSGRWSYCCGAGGKLAQATYPDFANIIAGDRLREAKGVADAVVTACPVCAQQLRRNAQKKHIDIETYDLPVLVAEAMGIPPG